MQQVKSSQISQCIDEISHKNCPCQLHQCIKLVKSLNKNQFDHLQELLTLFQESYTVCDQHNYPFEFYYKEEIKCKFCLHDDFETTKVQLISRIPQFEQRTINAAINIQKPYIDLEKNFEQIIKSLNIQVEQNSIEDIKEKWEARQKFKDQIEFVKYIHPTEIHKDFHTQIDFSIADVSLNQEGRQKVNIENLSHLLLQ